MKSYWKYFNIILSFFSYCLGQNKFALCNKHSPFSIKSINLIRTYCLWFFSFLLEYFQLQGYQSYYIILNKNGYPMSSYWFTLIKINHICLILYFLKNFSSMSTIKLGFLLILVLYSKISQRISRHQNSCCAATVSSQSWKIPLPPNRFPNKLASNVPTCLEIYLFVLLTHFQFFHWHLLFINQKIQESFNYFHDIFHFFI